MAAHSKQTAADGTSAPQPLAGGHARLRRSVDRLAAWTVALGGLGVIAALLLIFFYLFYVVLPLAQPARMEHLASYPAPGGADVTRLLALEEQTEIAVRFLASARVVFFRTTDGRVVLEERLADLGNASVTVAQSLEDGHGLVALGTDDGRVLLVRHHYVVTYPEDRRLISPGIELPAGPRSMPILADGDAVRSLGAALQEDGAVVVAAGGGAEMRVVYFARDASLFGDEEAPMRVIRTVHQPLAAPPVHALVSPEGRWLYLLDEDGELSLWDLAMTPAPRPLARVQALPRQLRATSVRFLVGSASLLVADAAGTVRQWLPIRATENGWRLEPVREFTGTAPVQALTPEERRKAFATGHADGRIALHGATAARTLLVEPVSAHAIAAIGMAPRGDALLAEDAAGTLHVWQVHNEHPEVSWRALWAPVWYEGYEGPTWTWQSSSATHDFEPKYSLVPLTFGTLKAAFYAMLLSVPLALAGAVYTAHFMAPRMRAWVKPTVEVMEALPTVILGFLAGLWFAPFAELHLPGLVAIVLLLPLAVLAFALAWRKLPKSLRARVGGGWEAAFLLPVLVLTVWLGLALNGPLEALLFGGDVRAFLTRELGIAFDQRNAIIVGAAMGFAVIPTIFSIAEDAVFGVPRHLVHGSLALGATPWQSLVGVVLPTASPGLFSAVMIGFGRAVGETMIVLMATGNTPVLDLSAFQGMRTLSANIAVEMPESEVDSTHYRLLFLAALVLFLFTLALNTGADLVRQRLRRRYGSL